MKKVAGFHSFDFGFAFRPTAARDSLRRGFGISDFQKEAEVTLGMEVEYWGAAGWKVREGSKAIRRLGGARRMLRSIVDRLMANSHIIPEKVDVVEILQRKGRPF